MVNYFSIISKIKELFEAQGSEPLSTDEQRKRRLALVASFKARSDQNRTWSERLADEVAGLFGSPVFVLLHVVWFFGWIAWNLDWLPGLLPFDPFPFGLLTMIVSLEAIFLSGVVLLSQNRSAKVADLREDVDLNINVQTELEVTKLLNLVDDIHQHLGLRKKLDRELEQLKQRTDVDKIEATIVEENAGTVVVDTASTSPSEIPVASPNRRKLKS